MRNTSTVLFDLYDTLVYADRKKLQEKVNQCAHICNVKPEEFQKAWRSLIVKSNTGKFPRTQDRVKEVLKILGIPGNREIVEAVTRAEHQFLKSGIYLFADALVTLARLQEAGLKLGMVTNASPSVRVVLSNYELEKYLQCIVVSSDVGYRKPDQKIYRIALEKLGVKANETVFVGDGNDRELEGAHSLGMTTVLVKRNMAKYVPMKESSLESVDFTVGMLEEVADLVLDEINKQGR